LVLNSSLDVTPSSSKIEGDISKKNKEIKAHKKNKYHKKQGDYDFGNKLLFINNNN